MSSETEYSFSKHLLNVYQVYTTKSSATEKQKEIQHVVMLQEASKLGIEDKK